MRSRPVACGVVFVVALGFFTVARLAADPPVVGDEPHYVLLAGSLLRDGDVDLANDYAERADEVLPGLERDIHAFRYTSDGPLAPVHNVGLAVLLLPAVAVDAGMGAARVEMTVVAAALVAALVWLLAGVRGRVDGVVLAVTAVAGVGLPVLVFSFEVYPDLPAALLVTLALIGVRAGTRPGAWLAGVTAALLPWLHIRFAVVAAGLLVGLVVVRFRAAGLSWRDAVGRGRADLAPAVVPAALSAVLLMVCFARWYGSPWPDAPYAVEPFLTDNRFGWSKAYRFGVGSLFSPTAGLLPFNPALWLGLVAVPLAGRRWPAAVALACATATVYLVVVGGSGPVVTAYPGRIALVLVPALAVGVAVAVGDARWLQVVFVGLAFVGAAIAVQSVERFELLHDFNEVKLPIMRRLEPAWPWFAEPPGLERADVPLTVVDGEARSGPVGLRAGEFALRLELGAAAEEEPGGPRTQVSVLADGGPALVRRTLTPAEQASGDAVARFRNPEHQPIEVVAHDVAGPDRGAAAFLRPAGRGLDPVPTARGDVPVFLAWVVATALAGLLVARSARSAS